MAFHCESPGRAIIFKMMWQDIVITIVSFVFTLSLVPQVIYGFKKKKGFITYLTSVPTCTGMFVLVFTYYSLSLFLSAVMSFIIGVLWLILAVQRWIYPKD